MCKNLLAGVLPVKDGHTTKYRVNTIYTMYSLFKKIDTIIRTKRYMKKSKQTIVKRLNPDTFLLLSKVSSSILSLVGK